MTQRSATPYGQMRGSGAAAQGQDVSQPVAGFYRYRLSAGSIVGGVRIWYGQPADPVTGELLDRSLRWQAEFDGDPIDFDRVWPGCTGDPISETQYRALCARRQWARDNAPDSAFAKVGQRYDPLSSQTPLPF